jgi:hypothetical protein
MKWRAYAGGTAEMGSWLAGLNFMLPIHGSLFPLPYFPAFPHIFSPMNNRYLGIMTSYKSIENLIVGTCI